MKTASPSYSGFTLLEMLSATAVFLLLMSLLLGITMHINSTWQQADAQKSRRQVARALLDTITRDLTAAVLPLNHSETDSLQFLALKQGSSATISDTYLSPHGLFWQASIPTDHPDVTDVAVVGYFVRWIGNQSILCRVSIRSDEPEYKVYSAPANWMNDTILDTVAPADPASDYRGLMAENVLALWISLTDKDGNNWSLPLDSRMLTSAQRAKLPPNMEVALVIVDPATARRITSSTDVTSHYNKTTPEEFVDALPPGIRQGTQIFRTRVNLETLQ